MVLAEKPPTWLTVLYKRLKPLIINVDTFREKLRIGHYPWIGEKGKKISKRIGKQPRGIEVMKDKRQDSGKGNRCTRTPGSNLRSYPAIGNQNDLIWFVGFRCMCWFLFCVPLEVNYMDYWLVSNNSVGEKIDRQVNLHLLCYQRLHAK